MWLNIWIINSCCFLIFLDSFNKDFWGLLSFSLFFACFFPTFLRLFKPLFHCWHVLSKLRNMLSSFFGTQRILFHGAHIVHPSSNDLTQKLLLLRRFPFCLPVSSILKLRLPQFLFIGLLHFFLEVLRINRILVIHSLYFGTCSYTFNETLLKIGTHFLENHLWKPGHKLSQTLFRLSNLIRKSSILVQSTSPSSFTPP